MSVVDCLHPLLCERPLIVYIDFKSPFAYLAAQQTFALADRLGVVFDWRPLTLNIPSFAGSATKNDTGEIIASRRSASQWSAVKVAYQDARRYAALAGLPFHAPRKIWESSLAGTGLLWLRDNDAATRRYIHLVFSGFWQRALDIEKVEVITALIKQAGGEDRGCADYLCGAGKILHDNLQVALFEKGVFGVPSFVCEKQLYFGREHLPILSWQLCGAAGKAPKPAFENWGVRSNSTSTDKTLKMYFDFRSPDCYLALDDTKQLAERFDLEIQWCPMDRALGPFFSTAILNPDRAQRHAEIRSQYRLLEAKRSAQYQSKRLVPRGKRPSVELANKAVLWARQFSNQAAESLITHIFEQFWQGALDIEHDGMMRAVLEAAGINQKGFSEFCQEPAAIALGNIAREAADSGTVDTPAYHFHGERFIGRAHLPYIENLARD